jgi:hypothetical protein
MFHNPVRPDWEKTIWAGSASALSFRVMIGAELKQKLIDGFDTARRSRQEKLATASADTLLKSIERRGFVVSNPLPVYDPDDVAGLVGEILVREISISRGFEVVFAKFETSGTSKSRGIDLVLRRLTRSSELKLVESKHLHQAVKGKPKGDSPAEIRRRFSDGLDEFERDRTVWNLAHVVIPLITAARNAKTTGIAVDVLDEKIRLLISKLKNEDYTLEVVACIDSKYCERGTLDAAVQSMVKRDEIGPHEIWLTLLETDGLEPFTLEACRTYG